jgi:hypothetical protein
MVSCGESTGIAWFFGAAWKCRLGPFMGANVGVSGMIGFPEGSTRILRRFRWRPRPDRFPICDYTLMWRSPGASASQSEYANPDQTSAR